MDPTIDLVAAIMGVLKAGGAYVPLVPDLPAERIEKIIKDAGVEVVISQKACSELLNRLQWECETFHTFLCMDTDDIYREEEEEKEKHRSMNEELWEYVVAKATDDITAGGWISSYTGEPLTRQEMDEYADNALEKIKPYIHKNMRVLEIGCASGITMYRIAPQVGFYYGTDLSKTVIEKNKERIKQEGQTNISLACLPAHRIHEIKEKNFDLVIMNSVIHNFPGHNYLRRVVRKCMNLMGKEGIIFIGDIMDQQLKKSLEEDMWKFKEANRDKNYRTTTDYSGRLFVSRAFWEDLSSEIPGIRAINASGKIHTIENELTKFRYDTIITVDKNTTPGTGTPHRNRHKNQDDLRKLEFDHGPNQKGKEQSPLPTRAKAKAHNVVYALYTSGTTGNPKGMLIHHRNLVNYADWFTKFARITAQDNAILTTSFTFDSIYTPFFSSLLAGSQLHVIARETYLQGQELLRYIRRHRITYIKVTPSLFSIIVNNPVFSPEMCKSMRFIMLGGEAIIPGDVQKARRDCPSLPFMNHYGPTETTIGSSALFIDFEKFREYKQKPTIGKPIHNTQVYILDKHFHLVPPGVLGELGIAGDGVGVGYLNQPELTHEKFLIINDKLKIENGIHRGTCIYLTGDLARRQPDGNIEFRGRIDHQVKIRGYRIEPGEIENQLLKHQKVKEAAVIDREMEDGEKSLCAYIRPGGETAEALELMELKEYLSHTLPEYMIPAYFVILEKIPLTIHGKLDRKKLPVPGIVVGDDYVAPGNEIEKQLVEIWSEVLAVKKDLIGIQTDFFQLGGHSLKVTILVSRIYKEFDIKIPLAEIFNTPTIKGIASLINVYNWEDEKKTGSDENMEKIVI
jgi:fengycin family lipopeptide synthetase D